jgi:hypothetical protein
VVVRQVQGPEVLELVRTSTLEVQERRQWALVAAAVARERLALMPQERLAVLAVSALHPLFRVQAFITAAAAQGRAAVTLPEVLSAAVDQVLAAVLVRQIQVVVAVLTLEPLRLADQVLLF